MCVFYRGVLFTVILVCLMARPSTTAAQSEAPATTFSLIPALVEKDTPRGAFIPLSFTLRNLSSISQAVKVMVKDFSANGTSGAIKFTPSESGSFAASKWVRLDQDSLLLGAGEAVTVPATLIVPADAEPGGHYAAIIFEQVPENGGATDSSSVQFKTRLTALLFLKVPGEIVEAGKLLGLQSGGKCSEVICGFSVPQVLANGPVPFSFVFTNTGNVHVRARPEARGPGRRTGQLRAGAVHRGGGQPCASQVLGQNPRRDRARSRHWRWGGRL